MWVPVVYHGLEVEGEYKINLLVEDLVVVELKVVEQQLPIHRAQLLSHLKLTHKEVGVLINVNVVHLRDGISSLQLWFDFTALFAASQSASVASSHLTPTTSAARWLAYSFRSSW